MAGVVSVVDKVAATTGLSKVKAREAVDAVFAAIKEVTEEDSLAVRGFGSFKVKTYAEKAGRNPATGAAITIPAKTKLTFKAA